MLYWFLDPPCGRSHQGWFQGLPIVGPPYGKLPILFPYPTPIRIPKDMGIVWEAYHKGVRLLGFPENSTDLIAPKEMFPPNDLCFPGLSCDSAVGSVRSDLPMGRSMVPLQVQRPFEKDRFFTQRLCFFKVGNLNHPKWGEYDFNIF